MHLKGRMRDCKVGSPARSHQPGAAEVGRQRGPQGQTVSTGGQWGEQGRDDGVWTDLEACQVNKMPERMTGV